MKTLQRVSAFALLALLALAGYALYLTSRPPTPTSVPANGKKSGPAQPQAILVDTSPLKTAQQLAQLADTAGEQELAKEALRLGDYEVDLAYSAAVHEVKEHPPALSADAKEAKERLAGAQKVLAVDDALLAKLNAQIAKMPESEQKDKLAERIDGIEADRNLAEDEADDAQLDLRRAGGDIADRLQEAQKKLKETQGKGATLPTEVVPLSEERGLIHRYQQWSVLHAKQLQLWAAKQNAEKAAADLSVKHNALEAQLETEKEKSPELAHHAKKSTPENDSQNSAALANTSPDDVVSVADKTWKLAYDQQLLSGYDKRMDANKQLSAVYASWIEVVAGRQRAVVHRALIGFFLILSMGLIGLFFNSWMEKLVGGFKMDRRQLQTLQTVTRVTLQVLALLFILLVIFGPPNQLATFLGLAGAGLTVALKDFIIGFIGWFVLMGKNGIRLGDWVEINGVTGEVVELGMFHTVLLETGNWTDSGHPTGRRVTFTNSYAIEGHYFNFSTSGQWLWDELQIVLPAGQDPRPIVDAIQKEVVEATSETSKQAEGEWRNAAHSRDMSALSAAPSINVKPVIGGVEIGVRYITKASERSQLRSKIYQAAVDLLGQKPGAAIGVTDGPKLNG